MPATMTQTPDPRRAPLPFALNVRLSPAQYAALELVADAQDRPMSDVVREAIEQWATRWVAPDGRSLLEHAQDGDVTPTQTPGWLLQDPS